MLLCLGTAITPILPIPASSNTSSVFYFLAFLAFDFVLTNVQTQWVQLHC
jgi:hypothetical protein